MKKITGMVLVWFCMVSLSWGGTLGDVNGDGAVGLPEAIHALQVSSGIRPQGATQSYDIADYFYVEGGNYEYRRTNYSYTAPSGTTQKYVYDAVTTVVGETIDGKNLLLYGGTDYYLADPSGLLYKGYRTPTSSGYESRWFTPPILIGSRKMTPGEVFTTFYEDPGAPAQLYYREQVFLGTEDVTVPAGLFSGCIKILRRTHTPNYIRVDVQHWARDVGLVKSASMNHLAAVYTPTSTNSVTYTNSIQELVNAKVGSNAYPSNAVFYSGSGVWNGTVNGLSSGPGPLTLRFSLSTLPAWGTITLVGFNPPSTNPDMTMPLVSQDGIHFSAWSPPSSTPPDISLTISGGTISGTYQSGTATVVTLNGTYSATP